MNIAILGASGRVGQLLINEVLASKEDRLVACYVSDDSSHLGEPVDGTELTYQRLRDIPDQSSDVLVDFSTPAATMAALENLRALANVLVVGTTGFNAEQEARLEKQSQQMPVMISANFAESFEPFISACRSIASSYPDHVPELEETYHRRKKAIPSGTSLRVQREIIDARQIAGASGEVEIPITIHREGEVVGQHLFRLDLGATKFEIGFKVDSLTSYARGALQAARWVHSRPPGKYTPADVLASRLGKT